MRGDGFRRGAVHQDEPGQDGPGHGPDGERTSPELIPETGRDKIQMFWESIGMKPGDDWKKEADDAGEDAKEQS